MRYIYDHPDWPTFRWDKAALADELLAVRLRQERFLARMQSLGFALTSRAAWPAP